MAALTNTQEEAFKVKLDLGCHTMLRQTVAADSWRLVAGGQDVAADTTLVKKTIHVNLLVVLYLYGMDNT